MRGPEKSVHLRPVLERFRTLPIPEWFGPDFVEYQRKRGFVEVSPIPSLPIKPERGMVYLYEALLAMLAEHPYSFVPKSMMQEALAEEDRPITELTTVLCFYSKKLGLPIGQYCGASGLGITTVHLSYQEWRMMHLFGKNPAGVPIPTREIDAQIPFNSSGEVKGLKRTHYLMHRLRNRLENLDTGLEVINTTRDDPDQGGYILQEHASIEG